MKKEKNIPVLILCGGYGKRLYYKKKSQKCLVKIRNKEFIFYIIDEFYKQKFNNFIFLTGYKSAVVKNIISQQYNKKIIKKFSNDGIKNIGVLGAINKALNYVDKDFILVNGDSILRTNYNKIIDKYYKSKSKALITVSKNRNGNDKNNILILKNKILKYSKENIKTFNPNYIDWGFYIFNKQLLQKFKYSLNNFEELINTLIKKDELSHYKTRSEYIQINTKENLMYAKKKINKNFKNKAVFFDRDGVLNKTILSNESPRSPRRIDEFKLYKSVLKIKDLREDYKIFIISNQPDIGRKLMKISHLNQMNNKINKLNLFDEIVYCYHKDDFSCKCRKPKNGMILYLEKKYNLDLGNSFVIGDRWKDIEAGSKSKCNTIFIDRKYKENSLKKINSTFKCKSLSQALSIIKNFKN